MAETLRLKNAPVRELEVDVASFAVPAQRFRIRAAVTKDAKFDLMAEFALRLLNETKELKIADLQAFFGLTDREAVLLVMQLQNMYLIDDRGGVICLTPDGRESFREGTRDEPRLIQVEPLRDTIAFDKVSFNFAEWTGAEEMHVRHLPQLAVQDRKRASQAYKAARDAFQRHFAEYLRQGSSSRHAVDNRTQIYSVEEVEPKKAFLQELSVPLILRLGPPVVIEPDFTELEGLGRPGSRQELVNAVARGLQTLQPPEGSDEALDFIGTFDGGLLTGFRSGGRIDPAKWVPHVLSGEPLHERHGKAAVLCGSVVSKSVRDTLGDWSRQHDGRSADKDEELLPLLWVRPSMAHWGRSGDFLTLARRLRSRAERRGGMAMLASRDDGVVHEIGFQRTLMAEGKSPGPFDRAIGLRKAVLPGALEMILSPGRWVFVAVHQHVPASPVPVAAGFCSAVPEVVDAARRALAERIGGELEADCEVLWHSKSDGGTDGALQAVGRSLKAPSAPD